MTGKRIFFIRAHSCHSWLEVSKSIAPVVTILNTQDQTKPASIRGEYERHGAEAYYRRFGAEYRNPHEPIIGRALDAAIREWKPDFSHVLDLAAGSGEVTLLLRERGAGRIDG